MKGKLIKPYVIDMTRALCAGSEVEIVNEYCTYNEYMYQVEFSDGTRRYIDAKDIEITDYKPYVDWEQRRYELAKEYSKELVILQHNKGRTETGYLIPDVVKWSVELADAMIEELKIKK